MSTQSRYDGPQDDPKSLATIGDMDGFQTELNALQQNFAGFSSSINGQLTSFQFTFNNQIQNLTQDLAATNQNVDTITVKCNGIESNINSLTQNLAFTNQDVAAITTKCNGIETNVNSLTQNLAFTNQDIVDINDRIDNLNLNIDSAFICHPSGVGTEGIAINNPLGSQTQFDITHPSMDCLEALIWDKDCNQWAATNTEIISDTVTRLIFRTPPEQGRYCVTFRGRDTS